MSPRFRHLAFQRLARLFDLALVSASFLAAFAIASGSFTLLTLAEVLSMRIQLLNLLFIAAYAAICSATFTHCGFYVSHRLSHWPRPIREILIAVTLVTGVLLILRWPLDFAFASNQFLILFWLFTCSTLALARVIGYQLLHFVRTRGRNLRNIVVIGEGSEAAAVGDRIEQESSLGYRLGRIIDVELFKAPEISVIDQLNIVMAHQPVDEVFLALPMNQYGALAETMVSYCEEQGIIVRVRTETFNLQVARSFFDDLQGIPVMTIQSGPADSWQLAMKRFIDIVGSAALLLALAPLFAVVALLIRLDSPGPVFFTQERVGFNKRRFRMLKFRTMVAEADKQQELLEHLNEAEGPVFKIRNDPRITRVGAFLRRFSIDELPQLINVLKGDMSLVGPRPLPVRDVERIEIRWHKRRFSIKPGITCLWQVNGRSEIGFDDWVRLDLEYIDRWSLALDVVILMKTIPAVFKGPGAY
jgi:exopolysaccharide biosynthesis polyprenyl glycosylphosphotransferase